MRRGTFFVLVMMLFAGMLAGEPLLLILTDSGGVTVDEYLLEDGTTEISFPEYWWETGSEVRIFTLPDTHLIASISLDDVEHCAYADQSGWAHIAATAIRTLGTTWADSCDTANFAWHADTADTAILADHSRWADSSAHADSADNSAFSWISDSSRVAGLSWVADSAETSAFAWYADSVRVSANAWNLQPGDADYIQNQASASQPANFWIAGMGWFGDSVRVDGNANIGGKLTVAGGIDPTYLALTPQVATPGMDFALWVRQSDSTLVYNDGSGDMEIITLLDTLPVASFADSARISAYSDSATYADTAFFIARAETATYSDTSFYSVYSINSDSAMYSDTAVFSWYSDTAGTSWTAHLSDSATQSIYADTASYVSRADSATYSDTASYALDLASGDSDYIQNQNAGAQVGADFYIDGTGRLGDSLRVDGNVNIGGKLTVSGGIDPTYLALTPQGADPDPTVAQKLWIDGSNNLIYNQAVGTDLVVIATTTGSVGTGDLENNSITSALIQDGEVSTADILDGTIGSVDIDWGAGAGQIDMADIPYTPAVLGDWTGSVDPGDGDDAFDQLAARINSIESGGLADLVDGDGIETFVYNGGIADTVQVDLLAGGGLEISGVDNEIAVEVGDFAGNGLTGTDRNLSVDVAANSALINTGGTGTQLEIQVDATTIDINGSNQLYVPDGGITETQLSASVAGTGLTGGAGSPLAVTYGIVANTAVEGNQTATINAGNGLTGDMVADALGDGFSATLDVGAGNGISVTADAISIDNTWFSGDVTVSGAGAVTVADDSHNHTAATLPAATSYLGASIESAEITDGTITGADIDNTTDISANNLTATTRVTATIAATLPIYAGVTPNPAVGVLGVPEIPGDMIIWQDTVTPQDKICVFIGGVWKCTNVN